MTLAGFWIRFIAFVIDSLLFSLWLFPLLYLIYGASYFDPSRAGLLAGPADFILTIVMPGVGAVLFWKYKQATLGKQWLHLIVVDAKTLGPLSLKQSIVRYFAYLVSTLPFCIGFFWIAYDKKKRAFHDMLAGSLVVRIESKSKQIP